MTGTSISPSALLKELDALWLNLGKNQEDPSHASAVLRACAMTLIAVIEGDSQELGETLALLVRDHPSRLIVVEVSDSSEPRLEAGVTAQCWMPFGKRQQICCEQIVLSTSTASLVDIPPLIRGLIVPDLPVACWVRSQRVQHTPEFAGVISLSNKLIVDSGGVSELARQVEFIQQNEAGPRRVGDLAWTRLTRWRQAIAQLFDDPVGLERAQQLKCVRIEYQGPFVPMSAYYLAAWLRHCVGRPLEFTYVKAGECGRARVFSVVLQGLGDDMSITVSEQRDVELQTAQRLAHSVFPRLTEYELLREELGVLGPDPIYEAVVALVPELLEASRG
jgi:glucose-6-phosphate dehydrogenase assembly protein OpcA